MPGPSVQMYASAMGVARRAGDYRALIHFYIQARDSFQAQAEAKKSVASLARKRQGEESPEAEIVDTPPLVIDTMSLNDRKAVAKALRAHRIRAPALEKSRRGM
eukprot:TRINITY_DN3393_c2_g5_i1.p1 TRINITY_DN3393_c2_g5~~TRINITY_DN3393_c2_g5_i1.p1  ORF type:complete len:111 (-),score=19.27 TRINITY_DN3393_c2_g5_i1:34-345(-)